MSIENLMFEMFGMFFQMSGEDNNVTLKDRDVSEFYKPKNFKVDLYPNQLLYSNFFREFENAHYKTNKTFVKYISCISDPVGSGKSYSVLGFLSLVKESDKKDNITTHIVVPFKLMEQWENYLNNTDLEYLTVNTTKKLNIFMENKTKYNLILFSNTFYNKIAKPNYKKISIPTDKFTRGIIKKIYDPIYKENTKPTRIILDEYETMYDNNAFFTIERVYLISSTLQNIFYENLPLKFIKYKTAKRNPKDDIPFNIVKKHYKYNSEYSFLLSILKVSDLNIIKSLDINNFDTSSEFIDIIFKNKLAKCKTLMTRLENKKIILDNINQKEKDKKTIKSIEETKKEIKSIECNIDTVNHEIKHIKERLLTKECIVCLDEIKNKIIIKCCCIAICDSCSRRLTNCVYCRKPLKSFDLDESILSKLKTLRGDISFNINSKIIILGNDIEIKFDKLKELALNWFPEESEILTLKGNTKTYNKRLDLFKNDEKFHILYFPYMSDICGFNLEFVTDIILLADLEDAQYKQIVGRAYRYGRTCDLIIHSFKE